MSNYVFRSKKKAVVSCILVILLSLPLVNCSGENKQNGQITQDITNESSQTMQSSSKSILTPALKRAVATAERSEEAPETISIILLVADEVSEAQENELTSLGAKISQKVSNKWFVKIPISQLTTMTQCTWIKSADLSQTRMMKK